MNSGFVSCGLDEWKQCCPNGLRVTMQAVVSPTFDTTDETLEYPICPLNVKFAQYAPGALDTNQIMAWDDDNQVAETFGGPPYLALFCNNGVWFMKVIYADGSTQDMPLSNPNFDRTNNVFQLDAAYGGNPNCVYRFTFTCN